MNTIERAKLIKAMEYVARQVNDENVFESWLVSGVADGDIEYGDLEIHGELDEALDYVEDKWFAEIMEIFLEVMAAAKRRGGLYCDGVTSKLKGA